ncbi:hypothetical protein TEQG_08318 [Trichophyton equinum CBS 127.97]|uniref:Uncharacterized protein n=1 Tax=Trichophyton equinum (strain ATCC MYA-4606 / CBS 127.97) TaxID=559882 RepID=F2Q5J9_TRIEC|nr:hypothetical protein TEQG_08318 [Trichophyton equinum CBS 127.97]
MDCGILDIIRQAFPSTSLRASPFLSFPPFSFLLLLSFFYILVNNRINFSLYYPRGDSSNDQVRKSGKGLTPPVPVPASWTADGGCERTRGGEGARGAAYASEKGRGRGREGERGGREAGNYETDAPKQLLWKEEKISILEEAIAANLRQRGPAEPAGDPAQPAFSVEVEEMPEASGEDWVMEGT